MTIISFLSAILWPSAESICKDHLIKIPVGLEEKWQIMCNGNPIERTVKCRSFTFSNGCGLPIPVKPLIQR